MRGVGRCWEAMGGNGRQWEADWPEAHRQRLVLEHFDVWYPPGREDEEVLSEDMCES